MPALPILEYPDPTLREQSLPVVAFDDELAQLVGDLFDTLGERGGLGLSAPQVGRLTRVLVVHVPDDGVGPAAYVNPEVIKTAAPGLVEEGCISVPGILGNVIRPTQIRVRAQDAGTGDWFERDLSGMHAVCVQHEIDHLDGRLFIDRLSWFRRMRIRAAAKREMRSANKSDTRSSVGL
jgi:peptide deformylase